MLDFNNFRNQQPQLLPRGPVWSRPNTRKRTSMPRIVHPCQPEDTIQMALSNVHFDMPARTCSPTLSLSLSPHLDQSNPSSSQGIDRCLSVPQDRSPYALSSDHPTSFLSTIEFSERKRIKIREPKALKKYAQVARMEPKE